MPLYAFESSKGDTQEVFFTMREAPQLGAFIDIDGKAWKRIPTPSQLTTNGIKPIDPHSQKAFRDKTGAMKGCSLGQIWDYSKEQSERRREKEGSDHVQQKYFDDYAKNNPKKRRHLAEKKQKHAEAVKDLNAKLKKFDVKIGLT